MSSDWFLDVHDFHTKFGAHIAYKPTVPPLAVAELRKVLINEECDEALEAIDSGAIAHLAKELADIMYVVLGTAVSYGIDIRPVWDEVHRSNMDKVGGPSRADGKVLKPEGWTPPDIGAILRSQSGL